MSTQQITKSFSRNSSLGNASGVFSVNGKLNINQGILGREPSLASIEESTCWQDKMKKAHADYRAMRS